MKLFIEDLQIAGKKVLMRVDFNVPLTSELNVADPTRIKAALRSIQYILDQGGSVILMSHLGRPRNAKIPELSLAPIVKVLSAYLKRPVQMAPDCIGEEVESQVSQLQPGEVLLLENLRFHRAEEHPEEAPEFAQQLANLADLYVNDAFGTAHRKHSSTYTITQYFPNAAAAGYLLEKEIQCIGETLHQPKRPFYGIIGGAKISTKIGVIKSLLEKVDRLLIGGAMAYTFLKAQGKQVGRSLIEEELVPLATSLLKDYPQKIVLPIDTIAAAECSEEAPSLEIAFSNTFPSNYEGLDIGPQTLQLFYNILKDAQTILWNGPVGVYELDRFANGTLKLTQFISDLNAKVIVGGGDLIAAINKTGVSEKLTHISTGGGATLEYIEFGTLPSIEALSEKPVPTQ